MGLTLNGPQAFVVAEMLKTMDKKGSIRKLTGAIQTSCCLLLRLKLARQKRCLCKPQFCARSGRAKKLHEATTRFEEQIKITDQIKLG